MPSPGRRSEIASLAAIKSQARAVLRYVESIEERYPDARTNEKLNSIRLAIGHIEEEAGALLGQVHAGIHTNPPLIVYGNPPASRLNVAGIEWVKLLSRDVHDIRYTHVDDGRDYKHDFELAEMYAVRMVRRDPPANRAILIVSDDGAWKDF